MIKDLMFFVCIIAVLFASWYTTEKLEGEIDLLQNRIIKMEQQIKEMQEIRFTPWRKAYDYRI